jgi:hypothetical protein
MGVYNAAERYYEIIRFTFIFAPTSVAGIGYRNERTSSSYFFTLTPPFPKFSHQCNWDGFYFKKNPLNLL